MKHYLFILLTAQFILSLSATKGYAANLTEDSHEYIMSDQGKVTVEKDIFGNTIIKDEKGNKKTIKKDIFGNKVIENY